MSRTAESLIRPSINRVRRGLPAPGRRLFDAARAVAEERREPLWLVGGAVRDCAAGAHFQNVDASVDGDAAAFAEAVAARLGAAAQHFPRFGTAAVRLDEHTLDLATLRRERYARPGALPTVEPGATIEQDLRRRDFTVNAVALGLAGPRRGEIVDPFEGLRDITARRLKVLHARSFVDDATRLWRGARYATRLGLRPEPETAALIDAGRHSLARISARRLWAEFERCGGERRVGAVLGLLDRWGVLAGTAAGFTLAPAAAAALRRRHGPHDVSLLLAVVLAPLGAADAVLERLSPPREARRTVQEARQLLASAGVSPEELARIEGSGERGRRAALWLDPEGQRPLQRQLRRWERTRAPLDAAALLRMGTPRGPAVGRLLRQLRRERYLGTLSSAADARRFVLRELRKESRR